MEMRALGAYAGRQSARLLSKQGKNLFFFVFFFLVLFWFLSMDIPRLFLGHDVLCTKRHGEIPSGFF